MRFNYGNTKFVLYKTVLLSIFILYKVKFTIPFIFEVVISHCAFNLSTVLNVFL